MKACCIISSCPFRQMMEQQQQQQMQAHMERERRSSNSGAHIMQHCFFSYLHIIIQNFRVNKTLYRFSFPRPPCRAFCSSTSNSSTNEHGWPTSASTTTWATTTFSRSTSTISRRWESFSNWTCCYDRRSQTASRSTSERAAALIRSWNCSRSSWRRTLKAHSSEIKLYIHSMTYCERLRNHVFLLVTFVMSQFLV